jgi:hypothetical protein
MGSHRSNWRPFLAALALAIAAAQSHCLAQVEERLWVDATVNGKPARFIFDTGASDLVLFPKGASRLGLSYTNPPKDIQLAPGQVPLGRSEPCDLQIGGSSFRTTFGVFELPAVLPMTADGVLGWQPLRSNIFLIDASHSAVVGLPEVPSETTNWMRLNLATNSDLQLEVPGQHGRTLSVLVDTGFDRGVKLFPDQWRAWTADHPKQPMTLNAYYTPYVGLVVARESWARKLAIGSLVLTDVPVMGADKADLAIGSTNTRATLGLAALKRLDFIINGKAGVAWISPKSTAPAPYEHNRLGAVFAPVNLQSEDLIAHVVEGSPAWTAGIRNGDMLTRIDDLDVTKWRTDPAVLPLGRFWTRPAGTKLQLTLKRGTQEFKAQVVLRQILSPQISAAVEGSDQ